MKLLIGVLLSLALTACAEAPREAPEADAIQEPRAYTYREVDGRGLQAHVFPAGEGVGPQAKSAVLLFHGGGWHVGSPEWTFGSARRFASLGMVAIAVEYRLSSEAITPIDAVSDACAAFAWARQNAGDLGIDPDRVAGYGVSAGGHLAAATATVGCGTTEEERALSRPNALLLWSPALDTTIDGWFHRLLQGRAESEEYSPAHHVDASTPPTSIVLGTEDTVTPPSGATLFCDRVLQAGGVCELNLYEGVGHVLTRNLEDQERDFDPDPEAEADGVAKHLFFLEELGFLRDG